MRTDNLTNGQASRPLTTSLPADSGNTWYFSGVGQPNSGSSLKGVNTLFGLVSDTALTYRIQVGFSSPENNYNMRAYLYAKGSSGAVAKLTPNDFNIGWDSILYVMKVDTHANGSIDVYMKYYAATDVLPAVEPTSWDLQINDLAGFTDVNMEYISIAGRSYVNYGDTGGSAFDEFRLGTTWQDVAPIPEPSALALVASGSARPNGLRLATEKIEGLFQTLEGGWRMCRSACPPSNIFVQLITKRLVLIVRG